MNPGNTNITDYCGNIIYQNGELSYILMPEGRIIPAAEGTGFEYQYFIKDHLGDTRSIISETGVVLEKDSYYPFGMQIEALSFSTAQPENKYLYNGKELIKDFGLEWYEYGFRNYDPVIGRFPSLDPKADKFAFVSPYNYAENRPIDGVDLWGLQYTDADGIFYGAQNQNEYQQKYGKNKYRVTVENYNQSITPKYPITQTNNNQQISQGVTPKMEAPKADDGWDIQANVSVDLGLQIGADVYKKGAMLDIASVELAEVSVSADNELKPQLDYIGNNGTAEITNEASAFGLNVGQKFETTGYGYESQEVYGGFALPIKTKTDFKIAPSGSYSNNNGKSFGISGKAAFIIGIKFDIKVIEKK